MIVPCKTSNIIISDDTAANDGTIANPLYTIEKAIQIAITNATNRIIYVAGDSIRAPGFGINTNSWMCGFWSHRGLHSRVFI